MAEAHRQAYLAALQLRIAEIQRDAAHKALLWAQVSAVSTAIATVIALTALLIAAF